MIYSSANPKKRNPTKQVGTSIVDQSKKDEANIGSIMRRYRKTGVLFDPMTGNFRTPQFGDFSEIPNFQEVRNLMIEADEEFLKIPARLRERFGNNVEELIAWLKDENNRDEAIELGLIEKPKIEPEKVQKVEIVEKVAKAEKKPPESSKEQKK
jgi:phage internal scaffolding protein